MAYEFESRADHEKINKKFAPIRNILYICVLNKNI